MIPVPWTAARPLARFPAARWCACAFTARAIPGPSTLSSLKTEKTRYIPCRPPITTPTSCVIARRKSLRWCGITFPPWRRMALRPIWATPATIWAAWASNTTTRLRPSRSRCMIRTMLPLPGCGRASCTRSSRIASAAAARPGTPGRTSICMRTGTSRPWPCLIPATATPTAGISLAAI